MEIVQNLFRTLMFFLDNIVYGLIPQIYRLFVYLSQINLFSDDPSSPIQRLVSHIYVLLGIFMLFKVSFSLIQYIVDPNAFRDSSKGMGKLITNVLIALVLLVTVPSIFSFAMRLQTEIIQSNAIGQLIMGTTAGVVDINGDGSATISDEGVQQMATDLQFMLYGAFYSLNTNVITECNGTSGVFGSVDMASTPGCLSALQSKLPDDATSNGVTLYSFFKHTPSNSTDDNGNPVEENCNAAGVCDDRNFSHFDKLLWWKEDGEYVINYLPFISAAAGVYVVFLLISFCVDIAVRAIKLCFLQMVAPIAIVSYIDPKETISNGKLHNWIKECGTTYLSLFLRLATIFLVMFVISMISSTLLSNGQSEQYISGLPQDTSYNIWIYLFLVIGAFMFAKQVPKIIESIFGIKGSGELNLNPFKNAGLASLTGGVVGAGIGGVASSIASAKTASIMGDNAFKAGLGGFAKGTVSGAFKGRNWDGKNVSSLISTPLSVSGDIARYQAAKHGTKLVDRAGAMINEAIGAPQKADIIKKRIENAGRFTKFYDAVDGGMAAKMVKLKDISQFTSSDQAKNKANFDKINNYNYLKAQLDAAIQRGDAATAASIQNGSYSDSVITSKAKFSDYEDDAKQTMYDMITKNEINDDAEIQSIRSNIDAMKRVGKENASTPEFASVDDSIYVNDASGNAMSKMKKASKAVNTAKTITENSDEYENAQAAADAIKSNRMFEHFTKK